MICKSFQSIFLPTIIYLETKKNVLQLMHVKQHRLVHINECLWMEIHHHLLSPVECLLVSRVKSLGIGLLINNMENYPGQLYLNPAIDMCNEGITVEKALAFSILKNKNKLYEHRPFR